MKLHEIELYATNPEEEKSFYRDVLSLSLQIDQPLLKVFDCGHNEIDFNISSHYPEQKISLSFLVNDVDTVYEKLKAQNTNVSLPHRSHLGLKAIEIIRNDIRIVFHSPTEDSPEWIRQLI